MSLSSCSRLGDAAVRTLAGCAHGLQELNLHRLHLLSDAALCDLVGSTGLSLRKINLSLCDRISDAAIESLALQQPTLISVNISDCKALSGRSLQHLAEHCPALELLRASRVKDVNDATLLLLCQNCPRLRVLVLSHAEQLSDAAVVAVNCATGRAAGIATAVEIYLAGLPAYT